MLVSYLYKESSTAVLSTFSNTDIVYIVVLGYK